MVYIAAFLYLLSIMVGFLLIAEVSVYVAVMSSHVLESGENQKSPVTMLHIIVTLVVLLLFIATSYYFVQIFTPDFSLITPKFLGV